MAVLKRREAFRIPGNDYVFHVEGNPLNYCTIQINYRGTQRKSGIPHTGTHIRKTKAEDQRPQSDFGNVIRLKNFKVS